MQWLHPDADNDLSTDSDDEDSGVIATGQMGFDEWMRLYYDVLAEIHETWIRDCRQAFTANFRGDIVTFAKLIYNGIF